MSVLVVGQVFVGACGFISDVYLQGTNVAGYFVFALFYIHKLSKSKCFQDRAAGQRIICRHQTPLLLEATHSLTLTVSRDSIAQNFYEKSL